MWADTAQETATPCKKPLWAQSIPAVSTSGSLCLALLQDIINKQPAKEGDSQTSFVIPTDSTFNVRNLEMKTTNTTPLIVYNFIAPAKYCHWNTVCDVFRMQKKSLLLVATIKYFLFKYQLLILDSAKLENTTSILHANTELQNN